MPKSKAANTAGCGVSTAALEPVELLHGVWWRHRIVTRDVLGTKKTPFGKETVAWTTRRRERRGEDADEGRHGHDQRGDAAPRP